MAMNAIDDRIRVGATFRLRDKCPELPELQRTAIIDNDVNKYYPESQSEVRVSLEIIGLERVIKALRNAKVRITRHFLTPTYSPEFWQDPPEDCRGAILVVNGHVSISDRDKLRKIVPLSEPLYINGRPDADEEHSRVKPHLIYAGGIPIVSDQLFATLRDLGAVGQTAQIIYRGFSKKSFDRVQPGFRRFLIEPQYDMPFDNSFDFLPKDVPTDFGICCRLRSWREDVVQHVKARRNLADDRWYDIAVDLSVAAELRHLRKSALMEPVFLLGGATHEWVCRLESVVDELSA